MKRKLSKGFILFCISLMLWQPAEIFAAEGKTSVSVSQGSVNIGDTVTVTVKAGGPAGEKANATMTLSYDSGILQFVSCNTTYGGGGNSVIATGESYTVTLKAVAAGNAALSVSANDGVLFDTNEELDSVSGSSASVTVSNAAGGTGTAAGGGTDAAGGAPADGTGTSDANITEVKSADNSLKSLTISPGTLSPAFAGKTTTYSATVGSDVTSIAVSAVPANEKAVVESVTGNDSLKTGSNAIKVVVKAENGVTATYTVNVTKQDGAQQTQPENSGSEEEPADALAPSDAITVGGASYQITGEFKAEDIPADFTETTVNYHGSEYKGVSFDKGVLKLLWMEPAGADDASGRFFVYDETRDGIYPFVKMSSGEKYVIALLAPADVSMPENYTQAELAVGEGSITAYQQAAEEEAESVPDFYVFYAMNSEGIEGWYRYDALEGTYQRSSLAASGEEAGGSAELVALQEDYAQLSEKYTKEKSFARNVIGILVFVLAVFGIIIINLLIYRFRNRAGQDFDDSDFDDEEELGRGTGFEEDDFGGDDFGGDDFEEDDFMEDDYVEDDFGGDGKIDENRKPKEPVKLPLDRMEDIAPIRRKKDAVKLPPEDFANEKISGGEDFDSGFNKAPAEREAARKSLFEEEPQESTGNDDIEIIDFNDL